MVILNIRSRCFHCNMFNRVTWFHDTGVLLCKIKFFLFFCVIPVFCTNPAVGLQHNIVFSNRWTVEIENDSNVDEIASKFGLINHGKIFSDDNFYLFTHPKVKESFSKRNHEIHSSLLSHDKVKHATQEIIKSRVKRQTVNFNPRLMPNDQFWMNMWYMLPMTHPSMHISEAWTAGYSGKNISVTILDDGLDYTHPDLFENYDPLASWDVNGNDSDPTPSSTSDKYFQHGTRCAGVVGAVGNNKLCTIGVAYQVKIGGIRMLDGKITDAVEALSLSHNSNYIDIYSSSWGPDDDGRTVDGPGVLARKALFYGVTKGRGGKGSIFVWATGNGGEKDDCNCDGYTSSIYTLSISSVTQRRTVPWYTELCSSTLAATYSSGSSNDAKVVTTDRGNSCTTSFTGTSASAPMAAGICALALEANKNLTWRDMQHLVVQTAQSHQLLAHDWAVNGAGRKVSHAFGFGLMNAHAMVMKARSWSPVPQQRTCFRTVISDDHSPRFIPANVAFVVPVQMESCDNDSDNVIGRLEHVQVDLSISIRKRGDLRVYLVSPMKTKSRLLGRRRFDLSRSGFRSWTFMTTHSWDEDPRGIWYLEVDTEKFTATLSSFRLKLFGTKQSDWPPSHRLDFLSSHKSNSTSSSYLIEEDLQSSASVISSGVNSLAENLIPDCQIMNSDGKGCSVCYNNKLLNVTSNRCVETCSFKSYRSTEYFSLNRSLNITQKSDSKTDVQIYKRLVCRPCPPLCFSCVSQNVCVQCLREAVMLQNLSCTRRSQSVFTESFSKISYTKFYLILVTTLAFLIVSITFFVLLCTNRKKSTTNTTVLPHVSYEHIPSGNRLSSSSNTDSRDENDML